MKFLLSQNQLPHSPLLFREEPNRTLIGGELTNESDPLLDESKVLQKVQLESGILSQEVTQKHISAMADALGHKALRKGFDFMNRDAKNSLTTNIFTTFNTSQALKNDPLSITILPETQYSTNINGTMIGRFNLGREFEPFDDIEIDKPFAEMGIAASWGEGFNLQKKNVNILAEDNMYDSLNVKGKSMLAIQLGVGGDFDIDSKTILTPTVGVRATYLGLDESFLSQEVDPNTMNILYTEIPNLKDEKGSILSTSIPINLSLHDDDYSYRIEMNNDILLEEGTQIITEFIAQYGDLYNIYGKEDKFALMASVTHIDDWTWKVKMQTPSFGGPIRLQGGMDGTLEKGISEIHGGLGMTFKEITATPQLNFNRNTQEVKFEFKVVWAPQ